MKSMIILSRVLSTLFRPSYYPTLCFIVVLSLTVTAATGYLGLAQRLLLLRSIVLIVLMVAFFTILIPHLGVMLYCRIAHLSRMQLRQQRYRVIPYFINIACYIMCLEWLIYIGMPRNVCCIIVASLALQIACTAINIWHKVSMHSAAAAGMTGSLLAYAYIYQFNPMWWLCLTLLVWGAVATSRILLRIHSLGQVLTGSLIGLIATYVSILYSTMWIN